MPCVRAQTLSVAESEVAKGMGSRSLRLLCVNGYYFLSSWIKSSYDFDAFSLAHF